MHLMVVIVWRADFEAQQSGELRLCVGELLCAVRDKYGVPELRGSASIAADTLTDRGNDAQFGQLGHAPHTVLAPDRGELTVVFGAQDGQQAESSTMAWFEIHWETD